MPELIEVELYRADLARLVGGVVEDVAVKDQRFVRPKGADVESFGHLCGARLSATRRHGKLLLAQFAEPEIVLGMRFGMTGRLLIDGVSAIAQLEYSSARDEPAWDRFALLIGGKRVVVRDQRCLGSVELDPDESALAPEAGTITEDQLRAAFAGRSKAVKSALLDQKIVAGLGNLLADEALWRAGIHPETRVDVLSTEREARLAEAIVTTVADLTAAGGSNAGESFEARQAGASCPRCGGSMRRSRLAGRTSWWCSIHQV